MAGAVGRGGDAERTDRLRTRCPGRGRSISSTAGLFDAADHPLAGRRGRGAALDGDAGSGHLRTGGRHRSLVSQRLSEPRWPRGAAPGIGDVTGGRGRGGHRLRVARAWRRGLPGRDQVEDGTRMRRRAEVRLLQRRRRRQRDVRRPDGDGRRPVPAHRGHDDRRPCRRRHGGLRLHPVGVPGRRGHDALCHRDRKGARVARGECARLVAELRAARAGGRRGLHLRRGDLHAGKPGGQARRGPGEAADPGHPRPVRQADGGEQRAHTDQRADDPCRRCAGVSGARRRAIAWHPGVPARRQHPARRRRGEGLRGDAGRTRGRLRRRNPFRAPGACGPGRRPARRVPADVAVRPADGLRGLRSGGCDGRPRRHRGVRRHRRHGGSGQVRDGVLRRRVVRQVHAVPGGLGARGRGDRPDHRG